jgi:hypothetical protein
MPSIQGRSTLDGGPDDDVADIDIVGLLDRERHRAGDRLWLQRDLVLLIRRFEVFHPWLLIATAGVVTISLVAALSGVDVARCLVILMLAPTVTVVGSEVRVAETPSP